MRNFLIGPLLFLGFIFLAPSTNILFQKNPSQEDKSDACQAFIIGISSIGSAVWIIWDARRKKLEKLGQAAKDMTLKLDSIFLEQIQANQGNISCITFATAAHISIGESQQYLERKSIDLNAIFNIDEEGGTSYHFPLSRSLM